MKRSPLTIAVGFVLLLIFALLLFCFQVRKSEVAVVTTFGEFTRYAGPGAHFKWPWPIQNVHKFDQRIHNLEGKFDQVQTTNGYNLLIQAYAGWNISDPKRFFERFGTSVPKAEESLGDVLRNAVSAVVGRHPFAHFVSTDERELKFGEVEQEMLRRIQSEVATNSYGLEVRFLGIKKLGLPESVTEAVFEQMRKERQLLVTRIQSEGERQASDIKSAADAEAATTLANAEAEATKVRALGESEAAKTIETFNQDPELANFILQLSALEAFLKEKTILVLDTQTSPLDLLKGVPRPRQSSPTNAPAFSPSTTSTNQP
jgi:membrane protease subunit HflC